MLKMDKNLFQGKKAKALYPFQASFNDEVH